MLPVLDRTESCNEIYGVYTVVDFWCRAAKSVDCKK